MKLFYRYIILVVTAVVCINFAANAQCTKTLNDAEDEYVKGRLLDIPNMLQYCLQSNSFSKEETIRAYKLLTLVYIFSDQELKAEQALVNLLKADPEHELQEQFDPAEIFYLYDKFNVDPIFRIGIRAGANSTQVNVINEFNLFSSNRANRNYFNRLGFSGEVTVEKYWRNGIEFNGGIQFNVSSFNVVDELRATNVIGEEVSVFSSDITESQTALKIPIFVRYSFNYNKKKSILPFVLAGTAVSYLLDAQFIDSQRQGGTSRSVNNLSLLDQSERRRSNVSFFGGIGAKFRSKKVHFFSVEARYEVNLFNYVNAENRFASNVNTFGLTYVPDNLSLNNLSILIGYTRSIYNPKKKKEYL